MPPRHRPQHLSPDAAMRTAPAVAAKIVSLARKLAASFCRELSASVAGELARSKGNAGQPFRGRQRPAALTMTAALASLAAAVGVAIGVTAAAAPGRSASVPDLDPASFTSAVAPAALAAGAGVTIPPLQPTATGTAAIIGHAASSAREGKVKAGESARQSGGQSATPAAGQASAGKGNTDEGGKNHDGARNAAAVPAPRQSPQEHSSAAPTATPSAPAPQPYLIYDSVRPQAIPASQRIVATYATGSFAVQASQVAGRHWVLWIDTRGTDPYASVLDVEPGDATPAVAAAWTAARLSLDKNLVARIYTMRSEWPAVQAAIATLPSWMQSHVHYWIADPTGVPHIVPGSYATQWYWGPNYDISTALPGF